MELEEAGAGCWRIRLIPNADWLHEEARVYPITIDPLTTTSLKRTEIEDAHVDNFNYGTNYQTSLFLKTKGGDNIQRSFLKFQLPQLKTGDVVVGAYLQLVSLAEDGKTRSLEVHRVRQTWSSDTITWNNRPTYDETVEDYVTYKGDAQKYVQLDLTNVVKEWYRSGFFRNYPFFCLQWIYFCDKMLVSNKGGI